MNAATQNPTNPTKIMPPALFHQCLVGVTFAVELDVTFGVELDVTFGVELGGAEGIFNLSFSRDDIININNIINLIF
jgi:hypothetical protein